MGQRRKSQDQEQEEKEEKFDHLRIWNINPAKRDIVISLVIGVYPDLFLALIERIVG